MQGSFKLLITTFTTILLESHCLVLPIHAILERWTFEHIFYWRFGSRKFSHWESKRLQKPLYRDSFDIGIHWFTKVLTSFPCT